MSQTEKNNLAKELRQNIQQLEDNVKYTEKNIINLLEQLDFDKEDIIQEELYLENI